VAHSTGLVSRSKERDGMDGNVIQSTARRSPMIDPFSNAQGGIMTNISKLIFGTAIAAVSIAHPALAQHASQNASSISVHHKKHLRVSRSQIDSRAVVAVPSSLDDPARPYVYVPGMASNFGH
jgi:hypothetical protein